MNNYNDQSVKEPAECPICLSSMTEQQDGALVYLKCDNTKCASVVEVNEEIVANKWQSISETPPKIGVVIAVRTLDIFGLGSSYEIFNFCESMFEQEEYETMLSSTDYTEWMDLT